jgi:tRNA pseudouridine32 synthase/23S rRNA pseudouridine746 synthase
MIIASKKFIISLLATFYFVGVFVHNDEKFVSCFQPPQHKKSTARIRITTSMATTTPIKTTVTSTTVTSTDTNTFPLIPVLFESSRVLIIHKPHGIGHHDESSTLSPSDQQQEKPGILQILRHQRREVKEDEDDDNNDKDSEYENEERLYGIHRLDKVTSGILVFAKDSTTASILSKYFQEKKIQKIYFGLSSKKSLKKKQGLVQGGMERSRNKGWILVHNKKNSNNNKKKSTTTATAAAPTTTRHKNFAKTRFFTTSMNSTNIINNSKNDKSNDDDDDNVVKTAVMFRPYTGKTHQLRVAAKSMGIPLLGDPIYKDGGNGGNSSSSSSSISSRTMLHASGIQIPAFLDHNEINIWCPPTFFDDNDDDFIDDNDDPAEDRILSDTLDKAVEKLMTKNCDVDGILEAMIMTNKLKHNANQ